MSTANIIGVLLILLVLGGIGAKLYQIETIATTPVVQTPPQSIPYVALGDSYTIGESITAYENFPNQLTRELNSQKISVTLAANPSRTGLRSKDLIDLELPVAHQAAPQLVTVLIGVNDWINGVSNEDFRTNIKFILDDLGKFVPHIVVIAIPDFTVGVTGKIYGFGRDASTGIKEYNAILKEEAVAREIPFIDIYPLSQRNDDGSLAIDKLHPSAKQYREWVMLMLPTVAQMISGSTTPQTSITNSL